MNDDRFGRDIAAALLKDDPGAVPAGLRGRVASVPDETAHGRAARSRRSSSMTRTVRMLEAVAAVVVVGAVVVGTLILTGSSVGVVPDGSASPSAIGSTAPSLPNPTVLITPTAAAGKTTSPSAIATWTGLRWSAPSVIPNASGNIGIVLWNGQYYASGWKALSAGASGQLQPGLWRSSDGAIWTQIAIDPSVFLNGYIAGLVATPSGLVAWGSAGEPTCTGQGEGETCGPLPAMIWTSPNGTDWARISDLATFKEATIRSVRYGASGLVAVGDTGFSSPAIWVSSTGTNWERQSLDAKVFLRAHFLSISATPSGYVVAGSTGGTAPASGGVKLADTGVAAAWWSDGQTWHKATVNRTNGVGTSIGGISVGADGMVAVGTSSGDKGGAPIAWTSPDGHVWQPIAVGGDYAGAPTARPGVAMLPAYTIDGDGTHLVAMGSDHTGVHVWISSNGFTWQEMLFSGATDSITSAIDDFGLVPGGLIAGSLSGNTVWLAVAQP